MAISPHAHARKVARRLASLYPEAPCALVFTTPFELLAATVLSAQCTDVRVNQVTPALFARFPDAKSLAEGEPPAVEALVRPTGFFRAKARSLIGLSRALVEDHGGEVPADLDALTALPGVGRKTAHVVLGTALKIASGVVVDTHVKRLARRLGMSSQVDPVKVERDLAAAIPRSGWIMPSHRLIAHGRAVCNARRPRCDACRLADICPRVGVDPARAGPKRPTPLARGGADPGQST